MDPIKRSISSARSARSLSWMPLSSQDAGRVCKNQLEAHPLDEVDRTGFCDGAQQVPETREVSVDRLAGDPGLSCYVREGGLDHPRTVDTPRGSVDEVFTCQRLGGRRVALPAMVAHGSDPGRCAKSALPDRARPLRLVQCRRHLPIVTWLRLLYECVDAASGCRGHSGQPGKVGREATTCGIPTGSRLPQLV